MATRFAAADAHYPPSGGGNATLVVSRDADFSTITEQHSVWLDEVADYVPGRFYERELPALAALLADVDPLDVLVVDGYVDLDPHGTPGLGRHVWDADLAPVVIGVAKTRFHAATHAEPVLRGASKRPLYVTAVGIPRAEAADLVRGMSGSARLPDALRIVDRLARSASSGLMSTHPRGDRRHPGPRRQTGDCDTL
ncbi:deoxyribonuclease V [Nocardioides luteus]|uniref:endonuclease V n=1 Tax=Nocardioides luteus TaxID=1844 RepID=UPI001667E99C|nr:endonuclease V [Nocardioides luteus]MDR7310847.1 deoxyribonuclease V [Nocardioides luteus]